ncbi:MAG: mannose-6-phosphate isomerase [Verrucomicrobia bacterium]|nr:MAG: mannose-6-phosphate isomerase [Verrucomicrobiota bacterium]
MQPIVFQPIYKTRVWGGRELESRYQRELPDSKLPFGESWEVVDRDDDQSMVIGGKWHGSSLHTLWNEHREEIFGMPMSEPSRFPILIKILDARDDLSIQVHPPQALASAMGGEPKTEMWYIADCSPQAQLYAGIKRGVSRSEFEQAIENGSVGDCVHAIQTRSHDSIFIPSGRLHAIGAGFLIFEIQQNSDTTYRVFDWNRMGLDGKPRELHVPESLASIDFSDVEPSLNPATENLLADCEFFRVERVDVSAGETIQKPLGVSFCLIAVVEGSLTTKCGLHFPPGTTLLVPRDCEAIIAAQDARILMITLPQN